MSIINRQNGKKDEKLIFIYFSKKFQLENKTKFIKKNNNKNKKVKKIWDKTKKKTEKHCSTKKKVEKIWKNSMALMGHHTCYYGMARFASHFYFNLLR